MVALVPTDPTALLRAYLMDVLPEWTYGAVLQNRDGFMQIQPVGGSRQHRVIDYAMVTLRSWHSDYLEASRCCREVYAAALALPESPEHGLDVRDATNISAPQYFPDGLSDAHRFQATVQLNTRPTPLQLS